MNKFFNYSGNKLKFTPLLNDVIAKTNGSTYVEPFLGSGAAFLNLDKKFDRYILNDSCPNIYAMWIALENSEYNDYISISNEILSKFGNIKESKESYYSFRKWYNETYHFHEESPKAIVDRTLVQKGLFLYFLANSCINSMLRFGPNGMNQGWGARSFLFDEETFDNIKYRLDDAEIFNGDGIDMIENLSDSVLFLDPPYHLMPSSYDNFEKEDIDKFTKLICQLSDKNDIIYTDAESDRVPTDIFNSFVIRKMRNTGPSNKCVETLNEVCYHNFNINNF